MAIKLMPFSMREQTKGCEIIDSLVHLKSLKSYRCHMVWTLEDLRQLEQVSEDRWVFYCYTTNFINLFTLIFLAKVLKKDLEVYISQVEWLKKRLLNSRINLEGISFLF